MVDVTRMPAGSFGYVPTPALVAPIEFTLPLADYREMGGYMDAVRDLDEVLARSDTKSLPWRGENPWPLTPGDET